MFPRTPGPAAWQRARPQPLPDSAQCPHTRLPRSVPAPVLRQPPRWLRRTRPPRQASSDSGAPYPDLHRLARTQPRSEEHTSELQSLAYIVCRLLLEKKKKTQQEQERERIIKKQKKQKR